MNQTGKFWAILVYLLPIPTFFVLVGFSRGLKEEELAKLFQPWLLVEILLVLALFLSLLLVGYRTFERWHQTPEGDQERMQKLLITFPKIVLITGMLNGLILAGLVVLNLPSVWDRWVDFLVLGYANANFFALPCYVLFIQSFERWNRFIPFSSRHLSMSLSVRVNLVMVLVLSSILGVILVAFKNLLEEVHLDAGAWDQILSLGLPISLIGLAGGVTSIFLLMRGILGRIERSRDFVLELAAGDMSKPIIELVSRDELGVLADHLNLVHRNMNTLLGSTKAAVQRTVAIKDELLQVCARSTREIAGIRDQVTQVDGQAEETSLAVTRALDRVGKLQGSIDDLAREAGQQAEKVQESSVALEQMIRSVEEVANLSASRKEVSQNLEGLTLEGQQNMKATLALLNEIAGSVKDIQSITGVIQGIAAQTNLLSMNASIEAAHAGEAGAGFAVVATEIRNLAETSSRNSQGITVKVKSIIQTIGKALEAGNQTDQSFGKIHREMEEFLTYFRNLEASLGEMRTGGKTILLASQTLKEGSQMVREKSQSMDEEATGMGQEMALLREKATHTRKAMTEVGTGIAEVHKESDNLKNHAALLDSSTKDISEQVGRFKVLA